MKEQFIIPTSVAGNSADACLLLKLKVPKESFHWMEKKKVNCKVWFLQLWLLRMWFYFFCNCIGFVSCNFISKCDFISYNCIFVPCNHNSICHIFNFISYNATLSYNCNFVSHNCDYLSPFLTTVSLTMWLFLTIATLFIVTANIYHIFYYLWHCDYFLQLRICSS